jgi:hypothetical protein
MDAATRIKELAKNGATRENLVDATAILVEQLAAAAGVKNDSEVAVLLLNATGNLLKFVSPAALYQAQASFPALQKDSLAATILATKKGKVDNKFADTKHLKFFELTKFKSGREKPIQKILALPILNGNLVAGVVEISRKGGTPEDSGPNFTPEDAQKVLGFLKLVVADYLKCVPKDLL